MSEEEKPTPWSRNLLVFIRCCFLNLVILCMWPCLSGFDGRTPPGSLKAADVWAWMFAFPARSMKDVDERFAIVLLIVNPLIYGVMWWFVWRMWRLMRRKPPE